MRHRKRILVAASGFALGTLLTMGHALAQPQGPKVFGIGAPQQLTALPPGRIRSHIESLPPAAQQRALEWLQRFSFPENDLDYLQVDHEGGVYYADTFLPEEASGATTATTPQTDPIAPADTFQLHSRPGSSRVVFLDFDGHTITGTAWNSGTYDPLYARPFDIDGDPTTFSTEERNRIGEVWHRVAEDYAPFDIDVTTEDPGTFGPYTGRLLITNSVDDLGHNMPYSNAGGVAYVGVWGYSNYSYYSPALVYYNNLGSGFPTYVAEAAAHEFGHNLSLSHDGRGAPYNEGYYQGHGSGYVSWAPIMGVGYYQNVTQWSKGEYDYANNHEDDISIINARLTTRLDDHGNTLADATPLLVEIDGNIIATNPETDPHNAYSANKGVIELRTDTDMFSFNAGAGPMNITVEPAWAAFYRTSRRGANLDIQATLYDQLGTMLAFNDPLDDTNATVSTTVTGGTYYLAVTGVGNAVSPYSDYASLGQYYISGSVPPSGIGNPPTAAIINPADGSTVSGTVLIQIDAADTEDAPGSLSVEWSIGANPPQPTTYNSGSGYYEATWDSTLVSDGTTTINTSVTDSDGNSAMDSNAILVDNVNDVPIAAFSYNCTALSCSFDASGSYDPDGSIVDYAWDFGDGNTGNGVNTNHSYAIDGSYQVSLTVIDNDGASGVSSQTVSVADVATNMHVSDLDASVTTAKGKWHASVNVALLDNKGNPVANATVNGNWSNGATGGASCTTGSNGQCNVNKNNLKNSVASVDFTVTSVTHASLAYDSDANGDPDGDSDGTLITVYRDGPPGNQPPTANFSYSCTDLSCSFDGSGSSDSDGNIVSYSWDFGDSSSGAGVTSNHSYAAAGTYSVTLTVTDDAGDSGTITQSVPVGVAGGIMHVGDLDAASSSAPRGKWNATIQITVHDETEAPVANATVSGSWGGGISGGASCTTDGNGQCSVGKNNIKSNVGSATFSVTDVTHSANSYQAGSNHDPDGDSDGTTISFTKP